MFRILIYQMTTWKRKQSRVNMFLFFIVKLDSFNITPIVYRQLNSTLQTVTV